MAEKNVPLTYKDDRNVNALRDAYANRADWTYFLVKEGLERGLAPEFAYEAFEEVGKTLADWSFKECKDLKEFADILLDFGRGKAQEGCVKDLTDKTVTVEYAYCPLRAAWEKLPADEAMRETLCKACGHMYHGIAAAKGLETEHPASFSGDENTCVFRFSKKD